MTLHGMRRLIDTLPLRYMVPGAVDLGLAVGMVYRGEWVFAVVCAALATAMFVMAWMRR